MYIKKNYSTHDDRERFFEIGKDELRNSFLVNECAFARYFIVLLLSIKSNLLNHILCFARSFRQAIKIK